MSRSLRNRLPRTLVTAVIAAAVATTAVVGSSVAQAANIRSSVMRRQHPGTSFFINAPHANRSARVIRSARVNRPATVRAPLFYSPRASTTQRGVSHSNVKHSSSVAAQHLTWADLRS